MYYTLFEYDKWLEKTYTKNLQNSKSSNFLLCWRNISLLNTNNITRCVLQQFLRENNQDPKRTQQHWMHIQLAWRTRSTLTNEWTKQMNKTFMYCTEHKTHQDNSTNLPLWSELILSWITLQSSYDIEMYFLSLQLKTIWLKSLWFKNLPLAFELHGHLSFDMTACIRLATSLSVMQWSRDPLLLRCMLSLAKHFP